MYYQYYIYIFILTILYLSIYNNYNSDETIHDVCTYCISIKDTFNNMIGHNYTYTRVLISHMFNKDNPMRWIMKVEPFGDWNDLVMSVINIRLALSIKSNVSDYSHYYYCIVSSICSCSRTCSNQLWWI